MGSRAAAGEGEPGTRDLYVRREFTAVVADRLWTSCPTKTFVPLVVAMNYNEYDGCISYLEMIFATYYMKSYSRFLVIAYEIVYTDGLN